MFAEALWEGCVEEHRGKSGCSLAAVKGRYLVSAGVSSLSLGKQGAVSWLTNKQ